MHKLNRAERRAAINHSKRVIARFFNALFWRHILDKIAKVAPRLIAIMERAARKAETAKCPTAHRTVKSRRAAGRLVKAVGNA